MQNNDRIHHMNILFLSHYFPPEVNAPATRTYEHCKRWAASGHNVIVVTCAPNCPDGVVYNGYTNRFKREVIDGITILRVWTYLAPNKGFVKRIVNYLSYLVSAVIHCIAMRNITVVIATSPQFFCGWSGVILKWIRKWPFILEIRDIWPESIVTVGAMKKSKLIAFLEFLEKMMYRSSDHIVAVGEGYRQKIIEKGIEPNKISVILNGVDIERFSLISDTSSIRKKYNGENKFVCSYIGTVGMAHGLEVMLAAAKKNRENGIHDIVFWIVGDGAERKKLQECAKRDGLDRVVFTGRLSKEEMPPIIAASDCCLVHLRGSELFGTVIPSKIFELMAMNIPIIMAVKGEARDIVMQGGAGVSMEPDNPDSLIDCIEQIRKRGKENFKGRDYVSSLYNRDNLAKNMLEIVQKVSGGSSRQ
jgi:glycosyltransferase involved in cell wall biosynthesis